MGNMGMNAVKVLADGRQLSAPTLFRGQQTEEPA